MKSTPKKLSLAISLGTTILASSLSSFAGAAELEEIVVTANKRAESINEVGLSISAIGAEKLTDQKLTSLEEISSAVPGLVYSASTANTPIFTLRGVGFNEQTLGAYPATSLYLDEAPMPFPVLASHASYDLERVEVLKGPQGILFGQNSTGGAINFIAAKPGDEFEAGGDLSYSRFNKKEMNGYISGPLSDTVGARLSFTGVNADEWQRSASRDDKNGAEDYFAARLIVTFEPTDTSRYMVNINGWNDQSDPQAQQLAAINPQVPLDAVTGLPPITVGAILAQQLTQEDNRAADWSPSINPSTDRDYYQIILRGDWDISDSMTLTALTTYQDFEQSSHSDGDGTSLVLFDLSPLNGAIDTWITEVRLAGSTDTMKWVIGGNYEKSNTSENEILNYIDSTNYTDQTAFINTSGIDLKQEITNYAIFGNVDYSLSDDLTLKVGARFTDSSIDVNSCNFAAANTSGAIDAGIGANVGSLFGVGLNECYTLNYSFVGGDPYVDSLEEDNTSWRLGLDYALSDDHLLYGNISKGYKTGSFPALAAAFFSQLEPVTQESVLSYEVGIKSSLADNSIQLNAAAFYYEYNDKQLRTKAQVPPFGLLDVLDNVPETEIMGFEADIVALVTDSLTLSGAITYLDSEVKKYENGVGFNGVEGIDFSGEAIPFTPEFTYSLDADYRFSLDDGTQVFMGVNVTGQSESEAAFGASSLTLTPAQFANGAQVIKSDYNVMDSYATWSARIGFETADMNWKVMAWCKNLTDEYYVTNLIASSDTTARFVGKPRTFGVTLGYQF